MGNLPSDNIIDFLESSEWFRALPQELQNLSLKTCTEVRAEPGDYIAKQGMPSTHWYGLHSGYLQMYVVGSDGAETTLYCLREGEWGGEGSLLKNEMRRYDLRALTTANICLIPAHTFETLRKESIHFNHYIIEIMNARMGAFVTMLVASRLLSPELRVARGLMMVAAERLQGMQKLAVTQHELSLICGLSRQRVNMALGDFKRLNIVTVEHKKGMIDVDVQKLKIYALNEDFVASNRAL